MTRIVIGLALVIGTIAMFFYNSGPRLMSDVWHKRNFVPTQTHMLTDYKCTTWNAVMFNECAATFVSLQSPAPQQITDWRFGPAPRDPARLLQRRDKASAVTTDVSLRTLWNRLAVALTLLLFATVLALSLIANVMKREDAPVVAPR